MQLMYHIGEMHLWQNQMLLLYRWWRNRDFIDKEQKGLLLLLFKNQIVLIDDPEACDAYLNLTEKSSQIII